MYKAASCFNLHAHRPLKIGKIFQTTKSCLIPSEKGHVNDAFLPQNPPIELAIIRVFYFLPRYI